MAKVAAAGVFLVLLGLTILSLANSRGDGAMLIFIVLGFWAVAMFYSLPYMLVGMGVAAVLGAYVSNYRKLGTKVGAMYGAFSVFALTAAGSFVYVVVEIFTRG